MTDDAVVTVGTLRAGTSDNVIPDQALLRLNVRTFKDQVRERVLAAIKRILDAEASASGATKPPEYSVLGEWPLTRNDAAATGRWPPPSAAIRRRARAGSRRRSPPARLRLFGAAWGVPAVFWAVGGIDPDTFEKAEKAGKLDELPVNHSPDFGAYDRADPARRHRGDARGRRRVVDRRERKNVGAGLPDEALPR